MKEAMNIVNTSQVSEATVSTRAGAKAGDIEII